MSHSSRIFSKCVMALIKVLFSNKKMLHLDLSLRMKQHTCSHCFVPIISECAYYNNEIAVLRKFYLVIVL